MVINRTPTLDLISPASFDYPWYLAFQGKLAETDTAELETTDITTGTAAPLTAIAYPYFVFPILFSLGHALFSHCPS